MYPVFHKGKIIDVIDIARIPPECPCLTSKKQMKKWKVNLDFGDQLAHIKKHDIKAPFINHSPFMDMLDFGPVETFDRSKVPKDFWLEDTPVGKGTVSTRDAQNYDKYRRRGGLYQPFGKLDASALRKPVFPPRSEGGCGKKDGCDDSLRNRFPPRKAPPKETLMVEDNAVE